MISVLRGSWAILLGIFLLMIGNGLQGGLLAYRGEEEGFSPFMMSLVMSGYFAGFLIGSHVTTGLIRRVGHVRVFAAFGSFISAAFIIFPLIPNEIVWMLMRVVIGLCFAGVYIVAESWLNSSTENEIRGQVISTYIFVQMMGIVLAAWLLGAASVSGYELFVVMSVLVSLAFAPILLSVEKAPVFETTQPMSLRELYEASPLGSVTVFATGGIFALQFTMIGVYTATKGYNVASLSLIITSIYVGGLVAQFPIGWLSDRIDRRLVIIGLCTAAAMGLSLGMVFRENFYVIVLMAALMGSVANPLYSVGIAYANDRVAWDKMAAASARMMFLNGLGAVGAPVFAGYIMQKFGADMFWVMQIVMFATLAIFALYRTTRRAAVFDAETAVYATMTPASSPVFMEISQEHVAEQVEAAHEDENDVREDTHKLQRDIINYWTKDIGSEGWFSQSDEVDAQIRENFGELQHQATIGALDHWNETVDGALALMLLLDQFSRNLYRGEARAFDADPHARMLARQAIEVGLDQEVEPKLRQFFYLPFAHSEEMADQDFALEATKSKGIPNNWLDFAVHREIIETHGRFPYRNKALGRVSTPEETEFLKIGGYRKIRNRMAANSSD